jgi:hypothetical protein
MKFIRNSKIWLSGRAEKHIKSQHPGLYDTFYEGWKLRLENNLCGRKKWLTVFLAVLLFFCLSALNPVFLSFLNFLDFDADLAKSIIDQRTTNIAAITSISLVVVGFLLTNLALKSPLTIKILFKESYLYFTIYLVFSTITCLILLSSFRNSFSGYVFARAVLAGTYLCVLILFLIGFLFSNIIRFTDEKYVTGLLKKELLYEAREQLKLLLLKKYSAEIYKDFASKKCSLYIFQLSLTNFLSGSFTVSKADDRSQENYRMLRDVNLMLLSLYISVKKLRKKNTLNFKPLTINESFDYNDDMIWTNDKINSRFEKWFLKNCMTVSKDFETKTEKNTYRIEFDRMVLEAAEENKYRKLESNLDAYLDLYKLQILNQKTDS